MASVQNIQEEEAQLGRWPRRLLHVASETSYRWGENNDYGGHDSPRYNVVTYTWGRMRLQDWEHPELKPMTVHNVGWDIPRVRPDFFKPKDLSNILRQATNVVNMDGSDLSSLAPQHVEFVWLDIACIDQRENDPRSAAEIGRQAIIFQSARNCFAWLSTITKSVFEQFQSDINKLRAAEMAACRKYQGDISQAGQHAAVEMYMRFNQTVMKILKDPWFTSLWTVQETFLRKDAVILSREGSYMLRPSSLPAKSRDKMTIEDFIKACAHILGPTKGQDPEPYHKIGRVLKDYGLDAISTKHPLGTYIAARKRSCTKDVDRIYRVQQVFGFRLGITSPLAPLPGQAPTLPQLEIEFGMELFRYDPVMSQMHVFTQSPPIGKGWLVGAASFIPNKLRIPFPNDPRLERVAGVSSCTLSVVDRGPHGAWGYFQGYSSTFSDLRRSTWPFASGSSRAAARGHPISSITFYLDSTSEYRVSQKCQTSGLTIRDEQSAYDQTKWLSKGFPIHDQALILFLGTCNRLPTATFVGILCVSSPGGDLQHLRRIGMCTWDQLRPSWGPTGIFPEGYLGNWSKESVLFG